MSRACSRRLLAGECSCLGHKQSRLFSIRSTNPHAYDHQKPLDQVRRLGTTRLDKHLLGMSLSSAIKTLLRSSEGEQAEAQAQAKFSKCILLFMAHSRSWTPTSNQSTSPPPPSPPPPTTPHPLPNKNINRLDPVRDVLRLTDSIQIAGSASEATLPCTFACVNNVSAHTDAAFNVFGQEKAERRLM